MTQDPNGGNQVLTALQVQGRVLHALILREIKTRYGKYKLGFLWALLEPAIFAGIFILIYTIGGRQAPHGMPLISFMLTGVIPYILFRDTMTQTMSAIDANRALLTFPQVTIFDLTAARVLLEVSTIFFVFSLLLSVAAYWGEPIRVENPIGVFGALLLLAISGMGLGVGFGALAIMFPAIQKVVSVGLGRPLFFTSGLFFTVDMMPSVARELLLWNPLLHMIEMVRSYFFVQFESKYIDYHYAVLFALSSLFVGLLLQKAYQKRLLSL